MALLALISSLFGNFEFFTIFSGDSDYLLDNGKLLFFMILKFSTVFFSMDSFSGATLLGVFSAYFFLL
jgi:hypothetical protein